VKRGSALSRLLKASLPAASPNCLLGRSFPEAFFCGESSQASLNTPYFSLFILRPMGGGSKLAGGQLPLA